MAAIAYPRTAPTLSTLRLQAVYRRRRAVALLVAATVAFLALFAVVRLTSSAATDRPIATQTVTVQQGDTLWSIASRLPHHGDVRQLVDQLEQLNGPAPLQPGQQISVPG